MTGKDSILISLDGRSMDKQIEQLRNIAQSSKSNGWIRLDDSSKAEEAIAVKKERRVFCCDPSRLAFLGFL